MKKLKDRPFALIGVSSLTRKPGELARVMADENLPWRSFDDAGAIRRLWNAPATPAFYLIDHEGRIRREWIGKPSEDVADRVIEQCLREAESAAR